MMNPADSLREVWIYLAATPLLGLAMTLLVYAGCDRMYRAAGSHAVLNPVLTSVTLLIAFLFVTGQSYEDYFAGAQFIHFLMGPATVALAFPLYRQIRKLRTSWSGILLAVATGALVGPISAVWIADTMGASASSILSIAPKSVTAPVGMGIAEKIGGLPSLTGVLVVTTGILGAIVGPGLLALLRISSDMARGVSIGVSAHGIGTARALQLSEEMGAFSGLAMVLTSLVSAFALPGLLDWLGYSR